MNQIPGRPSVQVVCLFCASPAVKEVLLSASLPADSPTTPPSSSPHWAQLLTSFWRCDQSFCDDRFKLIHNIVNGSWAMKMAVGSKPALIGKKIRQRYFRGDHYFEVDIDLSSSMIATNILSLVSVSLPLFHVNE